MKTQGRGAFRYELAGHGYTSHTQFGRRVLTAAGSAR